MESGYWFDAPSFIPCMFVVSICWSHSRIFCRYGDVTIVVRGCNDLSDARHLCPLSRDGSLSVFLSHPNDCPYSRLVEALGTEDLF